MHKKHFLNNRKFSIALLEFNFRKAAATATAAVASMKIYESSVQLRLVEIFHFLILLLALHKISLQLLYICGAHISCREE
jgi:hypothetical protein